jgi:hypothetical protein
MNEPVSESEVNERETFVTGNYGYRLTFKGGIEQTFFAARETFVVKIDEQPISNTRK